MTRRALLLAAPLLASGSRRMLAQTQFAQAPAAPADPPPVVEYVCPMDPDIRSNGPGICPRCGMKLIPGVAERIEYPLNLTISPPGPLQAGKDTRLVFSVRDPKTLKIVRDFEIVHEKKFHLFLISQDMTWFQHIHPEVMPDGRFAITVQFPKPAFYRVLTDFWPLSGTPQLVEKTILVPGAGFKLESPELKADLGPQKTENLTVEFSTVPAHRVAGQKTLIFTRLTPNEGIENYLGAPAHMLAGSWDLIDLIHTHPVQVNDPPDNNYKELQFSMFFPRAGMHRIWIQFQRNGVVNTAAFNVPVVEIGDAS
ncbi:MAG TPA: heavy metal-binding domain-containing protein [Bryobacteraceae bacterium]|nr:heavy metal-binding domain-containing protein [Bryobacteraceae bacterium]